MRNNIYNVFGEIENSNNIILIDNNSDEQIIYEHCKYIMNDEETELTFMNSDYRFIIDFNNEDVFEISGNRRQKIIVIGDYVILAYQWR